MKKLIILFLTLMSLGVIAYQFKPIKQITTALVVTPTYIDEQGQTIKNRVLIPEGYKRVNYAEGSFEEYVRNYPLKTFGAKVINYDGSLYFNQLGHFGVLEVPVPKNGLQQCADALIRIRSEYLWDANRKDEIGFNFTSGDYCSWKRYAQGYRPKIKGNNVSFHKTASVNTSKDNFYKYLNLIYTYSGTLSLYHELAKITNKNDLKIGDMLIIGGSPGHVIMIGDEIENEVGDKCFILFQGNTPAQSVHLLKNLEDTSISPWYALDMNQQISVPAYTFYNSEFVRFK